MDFYRRQQQNVVGRQECFHCKFRWTRTMAEYLDSKYLLSEFVGNRDTRGTGLPADATTPRALLIELTSMPTPMAFQQILVAASLQRKFVERPWCLEEAKHNGLAAETLAQIKFFGNLRVSIVGWTADGWSADEETMHCTDEKCQTNLVYKVFCGDAQIMSYDMSFDETHYSNLDCINEICEDK